MIKGKTVTAIILAAGNSVRYGMDRNKNFEEIGNKNTVLSYSFRGFDKNKYIDNIIVAAKEDEIDNIKEIIKNENLTKKTEVIIGGAERKDSVYNCIKKTDSDIVIIHDGARPIIKQKYINKCIENMKKFKGVTIGVKSIDTIKIVNDDGIVINSTDRNNTWSIQTPQCFDREILLNMHEKYKDDMVTDDCMLLEKDNYKIKIIEGDYTNIKITTPSDLDIIKKVLKNKIVSKRKGDVTNK